MLTNQGVETPFATYPPTGDLLKDEPLATMQLLHESLESQRDALGNYRNRPPCPKNVPGPSPRILGEECANSWNGMLGSGEMEYRCQYWVDVFHTPAEPAGIYVLGARCDLDGDGHQTWYRATSSDAPEVSSVEEF